MFYFIKHLLCVTCEHLWNETGGEKCCFEDKSKVNQKKTRQICSITMWTETQTIQKKTTTLFCMSSKKQQSKSFLQQNTHISFTLYVIDFLSGSTNSRQKSPWSQTEAVPSLSCSLHKYWKIIDSRSSGWPSAVRVRRFSEGSDSTFLLLWSILLQQNRVS